MLGDAEARARLDYWVSPRFTVGGSLRTSIIDRGDTSMALVITGHVRAFDGAR